MDRQGRHATGHCGNDDVTSLRLGLGRLLVQNSAGRSRLRAGGLKVDRNGSQTRVHLADLAFIPKGSGRQGRGLLLDRQFRRPSGLQFATRQETLRCHGLGARDLGAGEPQSLVLERDIAPGLGQFAVQGLASGEQLLLFGPQGRLCRIGPGSCRPSLRLQTA